LSGEQRARSGERTADFLLQWIVEEDASDHAVLLRDLSGIGLVHAVDGCVVPDFLRLFKSGVKSLLRWLPAQN
jgi:hypothetical protein